VFLDVLEFHLMDKEVLLREIADGLSQELRFGGHTRPQYTVAQHCVFCCRLFPKGNDRGKLLHDASEAYLRDLPKPLKELLPDYQAIEERFQTAIQDALNVHSDYEVKEADEMAFQLEADFLGFGCETYGATRTYSPRFREVGSAFLGRIWSREEAKNRWLEEWHQAEKSKRGTPPTEKELTPWIRS